jgi:hypothetical protein
VLWCALLVGGVLRQLLLRVLWSALLCDRRLQRLLVRLQRQMLVVVELRGQVVLLCVLVRGLHVSGLRLGRLVLSCSLVGRALDGHRLLRCPLVGDGPLGRRLYLGQLRGGVLGGWWRGRALLSRSAVG